MTYEEENKELRKLLWLRHGCMGLYGDDGEMQCSKCMIDFKRDSVDKIERHPTPVEADARWCDNFRCKFEGAPCRNFNICEGFQPRTA